MSVHAPAEALVLYQRALELWDAVATPSVSPGWRGSTRSSARPRTAVHAGEAEVAIGLLDEALALADPAAEPVRAGILHSQRAWYSWAAGAAGPAMYEHHASALALIPADPPSEARARAVTDLAYTEMLDGAGRLARAGRRGGGGRPRRRAREIEGLALNVLGATLGDA